MLKKVSIVIVIYFLFNLYLLDKFPIPTPDETWFANDAYSLTGREKLSSYPFENRLPSIAKNAKLIYGPVYSLVLSVPLRILPFGLITPRLTSVFLGAIAILAVSLLSKSLFKSNALSLLSAILISPDSTFLLRTRFVRPEVLVILFTCLAYLFYFRKKYFLTGLFISLSIFSHYLIGIIPGVVIILHYFLNKGTLKSKNLIYLILPIIIFLLVWLFSLSFQNLDIKDVWQTVISSRTTPNLLSLASFADWDQHKLVSFIIYLVSFFSLLIFKNKTNSTVYKFCLLNFLATFIIYALGNSRVYDGILTVPGVLCLLALFPVKNLFPLAVTALLITNLSGLVLTLLYPPPSYYSYGQELSKNIENNTKVFLKMTNPDPYLYLAEKRPDLKLDYFQVIDNNNYEKSLSETDYIITHGYDMLFLEDYKKNHMPQDYPFDLTLTKFLETNESKIQEIADIKTSYVYDIVVLKILKPAN